MRIGIDFDNTIVSYDSVFHAVAVERSLLRTDVQPRKLAVRDHLRALGREDEWTEMQGHVYGTRMEDAEAFPGVIDFVRRATARGHSVAVISHKTRVPFMGPPHDLHAAARGWIESKLRNGRGPLVPDDLVFFEPTKAEKLARVAAAACDVFIDDLPEILLAPEFPAGVSRFLFDPDGEHDVVEGSGLRVCASWKDIAAALDV